MTPREALKKYWGYDDFRPLQHDIINAVLQGRDVLGLMPTGGGKSITFQVPAAILPGLTLVVTPLISLMKDQVDNLRHHHLPAAMIHSGMQRHEQNFVADRCRAGRVKLLYVSPERLTTPVFKSLLCSVDVSLIVVDEAHCISQWGYDFRPSYLKLIEVRRQLPGVNVLALTATATPQVVEDIRQQLGFAVDAPTFRMSFVRHNISYLKRHTDAKEEMMVRILQSVPGSAIIYVRSRQRTKAIADALSAYGLSTDFYHAGLSPQDKSDKQEKWKSDRTRIMVATTAFGMGIDKPDVRVVIHADVPSSLEEYYQEAGRAGRDGLPAFAVLLTGSRDKAILMRRLSRAFPDKDFIRRVYELSCVFSDVGVGEGYQQLFSFDVDVFTTRFRLPPSETLSALRLLARSGYWDFVEDGDSSARVMMLASREDLYNIQLSDYAERVLQALLRQYTGLFADYVPISEQLLAGRTNLTANNVYDAMLYLTRKHVLHYIPRRLTPALWFALSRVETRHVVIPPEVYEHQRQRMEYRLKAMARYAFDDDGSCPVQQMLRYFGDVEATECGKCDNCREKRSNPAAAPDLTYIVARHPNGISIDGLAKIARISPAQAAKEVRTLADAGKLKITPTLVFPIKH